MLPPIEFDLRAHCFIQSLERLYLTLLPDKPCGEIGHFRALIHAINLCPGGYAKEVHGRSHIVKFDSHGDWNGVCEIADIALFTHDAPSNTLLLSFIQAKILKKRMALLEKNMATVTAERHQWDLLHHRPLLTEASQSIPLNIFSDAIRPSIGSYLFFSDKERKKALYIPAIHLKPKNRPREKRGSFFLEVSEPKVCGGEALRTDSIFGFGCAVWNMQVGSPIVKDGKISAKQENVFQWSKGVISSLANIDKESATLNSVSDFLKRIPNDNENAQEDNLQNTPKLGAKGIIIISKPDLTGMPGQMKELLKSNSSEFSS